ncbi:hypothetical protein [Pseudoxanthomonas sp. USHLN014]|uniref:hypothetical protein n=1 Tax=Pseudoxanthomonas sp. USHLN014 TaxID=3081297 RepID=UPI00301C6F8D
MRFVLLAHVQRLAPDAGIAVEGLAFAVVGGKQGQHLRDELRIVRAVLLQPGRALVDGQVDDLAERRQRTPATFGLVHFSSSASRKARAARQSRRTVRTLMSSICAISVSS